MYRKLLTAFFRWFILRLGHKNARAKRGTVTHRTNRQNIREFKHARFWNADDNRKWAVFSFNLYLHNHIYITKYLFSIRDD